MMKLKKSLAVILSATCALSIFGCAEKENGTDNSSVDNGEIVAFAEPPTTIERLSFQERNDENFISLKAQTDIFAAKFSSSAYAAYEKTENFVVSPLSVFMALSLASECAGGETRTELLNALGASYDTLNAALPLLYRSLNVEHKEYVSADSQKTTGQLQLTNSIWLSKEINVNQPCLNVLANNYYSHVLSADFKNANTAANQAVRRFVAEKTHGLIDKKFLFSEKTLFVLMNTLYLKDIWYDNGMELSFTNASYDFTNAEGSTTAQKLLRSKYIQGRAYDGDGYTSFYTTTFNGYKLKFLLPKDGYTLNEVFTTENLSICNSIRDYNALDEENLLRYNTRCLFPKYTATYDEDVSEVLKKEFGVNNLFNNSDCDFSSITDDNAYCSSVLHAANLTVDEKGIEGAAVTVLPAEGASGPDEYTDVYVDFIVDRAFGFIITDWQNVTLFSGVIKNI